MFVFRWTHVNTEWLNTQNVFFLHFYSRASFVESMVGGVGRPVRWLDDGMVYGKLLWLNMIDYALCLNFPRRIGEDHIFHWFCVKKPVSNTKFSELFSVEKSASLHQKLCKITWTCWNLHLIICSSTYSLHINLYNIT